MEHLIRPLRTYSLRGWFYILVAAFILWPFIMYVVLKLVYGTSIAPDYQASWWEHTPVVVFMVVNIIIQAALLVVSIRLLNRTVRIGYKVVFFLAALVALVFLYLGVAGMVSYIDLVG